MKKKLLFGLLILFIGIQFIRIDKTPIAEDAALTFHANMNAPADVLAILDIACMDCHSNITSYPWYSNVAPVSWWMNKHINNGRDELNFSEWLAYEESKRSHKASEVVEVVEKKEMPMLSYWIIHHEAKLSDEQRDLLVTYFESIQ